ncbi:hypothetical protein [Pelagibius sp.]|uniref:hypothetical protein n=1 Tax=Pelagibius sp. TaxID=1931238 RepID=UPI003BAFD84F
MSDRLLAVTLALCLALPLCLSLDGDLFGGDLIGRNAERTAHRQVEELLGVNLVIEAAVERDRFTERAGEEDRTADRQGPVSKQGAMPPQAAALSGPNLQSDLSPAPPTVADTTAQR